MLRVSQVKLTIDEDLDQLEEKLCKKLRISKDELIRFSIVRESIDARKDPIMFSYTLECEVRHEAALLRRRLRDVARAEAAPFTLPEQGSERLTHRPVVIGFGPSGMFAGLLLAQNGYRPIILERGSCVETRTRRVQEFWAGGQLDPQCNVQFGEGGAGTFSDGKLTTRSKDPRCHHVLEELVRFGAPEQILYEAHPHIGTDILSGIVKAIRSEIIALGGEVRFDAQAEDFLLSSGALRALIVNGEELPCEQALLCIGHSARDTMRTLHACGMQMEAKAFAVGVRVEHPQQMIDQALYGRYAGHPRLGAASYRMSSRTSGGRGVYTFCMCPGGSVVGAASESGGVVTNGMSAFARDGENSNAALLVGVSPEDFGAEGPLTGVAFQRAIERAAFEAGGGDYSAPCQRVGDFLERRRTAGFGAVRPTYQPGVAPGDLRAVLPGFVCNSMAQGIREMGKKLRGFDDPDALLTTPETRSSSPVRILRGENRECPTVRGLFPCGEGAGYAGGITSAAVDGLRCAEEILRRSADFSPHPDR